MQRSKQLALMFLLGAGLVGGALGFTADRYLAGDRLCSRSEGRRAKLAADLDLTAEQRTQLDAILDERHRQMDSILAPVRPQLESVSESTRGQIRAMLTPEQRERFDELRRRAVAEREAEKAARGKEK